MAIQSLCWTDFVPRAELGRLCEESHDPSTGQMCWVDTETGIVYTTYYNSPPREDELVR